VVEQRGVDYPLVRARDLNFAYERETPVLSGVDLDLCGGEMLFVLGANGSGKTTLLNLLSGSLTPGGGSVELGGEATASMTPRELARRMAVVPQSLDGVHGVPVRRFVMGGRYAHVPVWGSPGAHDEELVLRSLEQADGAQFAGRMMGQLSSGQRQRVLLARALAQEAPALLLDEPTTALDPEHQIGVLDLIHLQAQAGTAVLVVTHDLNLTSQYASRVVLLAEGGVAAEGTPEEVLRPEVLTPIYGACLWFGAFPDSGRPIVLPRGQ
jgi:iron complex transport system ATP-binding protein